MTIVQNPNQRESGKRDLISSQTGLSESVEVPRFSCNTPETEGWKATMRMALSGSSGRGAGSAFQPVRRLPSTLRTVKVLPSAVTLIFTEPPGLVSSATSSCAMPWASSRAVACRAGPGQTPSQMA
ncbi:MAG: hypothetical protein LW857_04955 [Verrucomicrobiae bacterium]|nr:hypothetical protein [Verrucomicrobiae bacterium]